MASYQEDGGVRMKTTEVRFEVPNDILYTLNEDKDEFVKTMKLLTAIELYKTKKLSMGKASELAEMNKITFMNELGRQHVPVIDYDEEGLRNEIESALRS